MFLKQRSLRIKIKVKGNRVSGETGDSGGGGSGLLVTPVTSREAGGCNRVEIRNLLARMRSLQ